MLNGKLDSQLNSITGIDKANMQNHIDDCLMNGKIGLIIAVDQMNENLNKIILFFQKFTNISFHIVTVGKYNNNGSILYIPTTQQVISQPSNTIKPIVTKVQQVTNDRFYNDVIEYYNSICDKEYPVFRKKSTYSQISIINSARDKLHYEFIIRQNATIGIEIHTFRE